MAAAPQVLVTGATGFVGSAIARRLLAAGYAVRCLVRPAGDRRNVAELDVELFEGDLLDPASLAAAARGCAYVFHAAAEYRIWRPDPAVFYRVNVEGTEALLAAAREAGVERVVYTSSVATLGCRGDGEPGDEETPVGAEDMVGHYKRSKFLAEEAVRRFAGEHGLDVVILNPAAPIGPRDVKPTPTGRLVLDAAAGKMPAYVDTGLNVVHVDDVADGHLRALQHGRSGERYVLGAENLTLREILHATAAIVGRTPPRVRLAPEILVPFAYAAQGWARLARTAEPRLTVDGLRMARKKMFFSERKARAELGFEPRPAADAIRDAVAWFRRERYF